MTVPGGLECTPPVGACIPDIIMSSGGYFGSPPPLQVEIVRFTAEPGATAVPPDGFWTCTVPGSTQLSVDPTVPTARPVAVMAFAAKDRSKLSTFGTLQVETVMFTAEPGATAVPPDGLCDRTVPG